MRSSTLFSVLGPVTLGPAEAPGPRARKPLTVLAVLLVNANAWVRAGTLIEATWPEQDVPASANANLKTYVSQLRKALPADRIEHAAGCYRLRVEPGELDVHHVERLATTARHALRNGDPRTAVAAVTDALGRWRGQPFGGVDVEALRGASARLGELRTDLRAVLAESYAALGELTGAIAVWRTLVDDDPFTETHWARWMTALNSAGRHTEALAVHDRVRAFLRRELGVEPGRELTAARDVATAGLTAAVRPARRDLPRDLPDFTGRAAEIHRLESLAQPGGTRGGGVVVVDGVAGAGKSALAVHVAHRLAPRYPDAALYLDLRELPAAAALEHLLRAVGAVVPADPAVRAAQWRAELAGRRVLLVLDNAVDARQVRPLLPGGGDSLVLVTTRVRTPLVDGAHRLTLGPMPAREAAHLFATLRGEPHGTDDLATARRGRRAADLTAVTEVLRLCGNLPAALRAAADRLHSRPMWTVAGLAARLADGSARICDLSPAADQLAAAYRDLSPAAQRVLSALAADTAVHLDSHEQLLLEDLLDLGLVTQPAADRFAPHPLVRDLVHAAPPARPARIA
ncbi:AfsR/SARP family transcriptional regulator [Nocardia sp. NRRL S-836]|uniref:AfsR/SARP family transcriptional regulator n=1 Tax=Nocardia sp. NRRL S-836 TaxID=1519492 RepID=UPI0006AFC4DE|nr:AfsR/SARP family transcriptional regulator [Nocardia sp. NRRL S-836]